MQSKTTRLACTVYRSSKVEDMYLYVEETEDLARVPEPLLNRFGKPQRALSLVLDEGRKLARADINKVMEAIITQGFYLQVPALHEDYLPTAPDYKTVAAKTGAARTAPGAEDQA